jgi:vacuolar-type H+-ATPase subunit E/Vma4
MLSLSLFAEFANQCDRKVALAGKQINQNSNNEAPMSKYQRRYKAELESLIAMVKQELTNMDSDPQFVPSMSLLTAFKEARDAGLRMEVAIDCAEQQQP